LIVEFTQNPKRKNLEWKVLLHVFSDGEDNASDKLRKQELGTEKTYIKEGKLGNDTVHHRFLYSFNSQFEQVKTMGEEIGATVIMVQTDNIQQSLNERNKVIFRYFRKEKKRRKNQ